ncbi:MAG TPA: YSC84-related protein [Burkholderiaceae bacterium]|jgi:lipid-binding SYLF domain-containing protein|nr:YSC84-related protein [Burkholderiaceae bacterium]
MNSRLLRSLLCIVFFSSMGAGTAFAADSQGGSDAKRAQITADTQAALARLYSSTKGSRELVAKARGVLVFPSVLSGGIGIGGQYGQGELLINGQPAGFYSTSGLTLGAQLGAQSKAIFVLFLTQDALDSFRSSSGWTAGVDANVALMKVGTDGSVDTETGQTSVIGFVLTNSGLMFDLSIAGTKVSPISL